MSMEMWYQVKKFSDGENLNAKTLNVPIGQLGARTDYLYERLSELMLVDKLSSVVITGVTLSTKEGEYPEVGNAVYLHQNDNEEGIVASKAKATMSMYDDFMAAESAFTIGILSSRNDTTGNVIVYGKMALGSDGQISKDDIIESGEEFRPGRYYLSANEAGKLTVYPNGPLIYVCSIGGHVVNSGNIDGTAVLNPQFLDIGTSHVHRSAVMTARPAGTFSTNGYLPIAAQLEGGSGSPDDKYIAIRFGGTWTADKKIDYAFYIDQETRNWPDGVWLKWTEDGGEEKSVSVPAPDVEVQISNGLTARLSFPGSDSSVAFEGLTPNERTWEQMTFPDAAQGWLDHKAFAVGTYGTVNVAVRGNMPYVETPVTVSFPSGASVSSAGSGSGIEIEVSVAGASPVSATVGEFVWKSVSGIEVMVYNGSPGVVDVPSGTSVDIDVYDDEPKAVYDYVLGMDPAISNYWPPVPVKSAALVVNGVEMDNKVFCPRNPTVSFGRDTIHWFEDDAGRKPWPEQLQGRDDSVDPSDEKLEVMHWIRGFQCASGPVTSIQPKPGSPIKLYRYGTHKDANTGDLEIDAAVDFEIEAGGAPGYMVPKRSENGKLIAGPVVERVVAGPGIKIMSKPGSELGQGTVVVSLDDGSFSSQFSDIALENAEQAKIGMFPYIRLRGYSGNTITHPSAFTATVRIPTNIPNGKYAMRLSASVFGEEGFSGNSVRTACVKLSYNILPDFSAPPAEMYRNLKTGLLKPDVERNVQIDFGHSAGGGIVYDGFDPIAVMTDDGNVTAENDVVSKAFGHDIPYRADFAIQGKDPALRPGYLVGIRMSRAVTNSTGTVSYTYALGFINLSWSLVSVE